MNPANFINKLIAESVVLYLRIITVNIIIKDIKLKAVGVSGNYIEIDTVEDLESTITKQRVLTF